MKLFSKLFTPRPEQQKCLDILEEVRMEGRDRALVVMATGTGKTAVAAFDAKNLIKKTKKQALFLCHQNDILEQARETYEQVLGKRYTYGYFNGLEKTEKADVLFASFQTMQKYKEEFVPDQFCHITVDESHHSEAATYRPVIEYFNPDFLLALTATPNRSDLKDIRTIYGSEVYSLPIEEAIARGLLARVDYRLITDDLLFLEEIDTPIGKLSIKELNRRLFLPQRDEEIVSTILEKTKHIANPRIIMFCQSIEYTEKLAQIMPNASALHSEVKPDFYRKEMQKFRKGKLSTVLTVDKFNEGIDIPEANVIVFLRSTDSETIFFQQLGRGLRKTKDNKDVLILDFVANCERIEMIDELRKKVKKAAEDIDPYGDLDNDFIDEPEDENEAETVIVEGGQFIFNHQIRDVLEIIKRIRTGYTKEELIGQLIALAQQLGRTPTAKDIGEQSRREACAGIYTFANFFGSFNNALEVAGIRINKKGIHTQRELIQQLQNLAEELGRTPTVDDLNDKSKDGKIAGSSTFKKYFGSFNKALEAAGVTLNMRMNRGHTKVELIQQLQNLAEELGRTPRMDDVDKQSKFGTIVHSATFSNHFGSFNKALEIASLKKNLIRRNYTREDLIHQLQSLANELGKTPTTVDVNKKHQVDQAGSIDAFQKVFGSFNKALEAAGLQINKKGGMED